VITQYTDFLNWSAHCRAADAKINKSEGQGEDPFTHYYAINLDCETVGYYGEANGADQSHGVLCDTPLEYQREMG
jgi:hypothetical protein